MTHFFLFTIFFKKFPKSKWISGMSPGLLMKLIFKSSLKSETPKQTFWKLFPCQCFQTPHWISGARSVNIINLFVQQLRILTNDVLWGLEPYGGDGWPIGAHCARFKIWDADFFFGIYLQPEAEISWPAAGRRPAFEKKYNRFRKTAILWIFSYIHPTFPPNPTISTDNQRFFFHSDFCHVFVYNLIF